MWPRFMFIAPLREWTIQSLIVHQTHLILVSGRLVLQKKILTWIEAFKVLRQSLLNLNSMTNEPSSGQE